jgi:hypothetical protein
VPTAAIGPGCATPAERAPGASAAPITDGARLANAMTELPAGAMTSATTQLLRRAHRTLGKASRVVTVPTRRYRDLPDFLIIGAQRCGTTSMYRYLAQHPAVAPAVLRKGVHYFDLQYTRGDDWYASHFPSRPYKAMLSRRAGQSVFTGEGSPYYLFHPAVASRVATTIPSVRLIVMLRDPISRAYSHYQHEVARGFESLPFEDALKMEEERLAGEAERLCADPNYYSFSHQHHSYASRGVYVDQLRRWMALFPQTQILIVDSGDFFAQPERAYSDVLAFLGLRDHSLKRYPNLNAHRYDPMSDRARAFLEAVFDEPNRALNAFLARAFSW